MHSLRAHARRFTTFSLIGVMVFFFSEAILYSALLLGLSTFWAYLVQALLSIEASFIANRRWVFPPAPLWSSFWKFNLSRIGTVPAGQVVFVALVWLGSTLGGDRAVVSLAANAFVVGLFTAVNYVIGWTWAFRQHGVNGSSTPTLAAGPRATGARPSVAVVVPVKRSQLTMRACVRSLLEQSYPPSEVVLVGDVGDESWAAVQDYLQSGQVTAIQVRVNSTGRDANAKRNVGLDYAVAKGYEVLVLTDSDMVLPPGWLACGVRLLSQGWPCVAGPMQSAGSGFWSDYVDKNPLLPKTPRMARSYVVTKDNFGRRKPPITANAFFTRAAYELVGGLDADFVRDYEDYEFFARMASLDLAILCTHELAAWHHHRSGLRVLLKDYVSTGWGCADFVKRRAGSPLAKKRLHQVTILRTAGIVGPVSVTLALLAWNLAALLLVISGFTSYGAVAAYSILKVHSAKALLFPLVTAVFLVAFMRGFDKGRIHNRTHEWHTTVEYARLFDPAEKS